MTTKDSTPLVRDGQTEIPASPNFDLPRRLGFMADAMIHAKVGPQARFYTRERVDEIVLLLREAEKALIAAREERRAMTADAERLARFGEATGASPWT